MQINAHQSGAKNKGQSRHSSNSVAELLQIHY